MTTRGEINSNFYQIVNVDSNGAPTSVKPEYLPNVGNANYATNANFASYSNIANSANSVAVANVSGIGNIATINLNGNGSQLLAGNGAWVAQGTTANANYANFAGTAFNVSGSNVTGAVANATYATSAGSANTANIANTANSVAVANVSGIGNIATVNLTGSTSNVLYGNGVFAAIPSVSNVANANYANFAGTAFNVSGSNVTGTVANATYSVSAGSANTANTANSVAVANVTGIGNIATVNLTGSSSNVLYGNGTFAAIPTVSNVANANYANFAGTAFNVSGSNVSGQVANANYSNFSNVANTANSVAVANVTGIGNIATTNYNGNGSTVLAGNGTWISTGTAVSANFANYAGNVTVSSQPNITSVGNLVNLQFNNTVTPIATPNIGEMFWDTGEHTVTLGMENGVKQQIGLESYIWVKASAAITDGQVVMWTGAQGDNVTAAPANVAVAGFRAGYVLGVATQSIANNGFGYITTFGQVHGLNTNAYNAGDLLWLDPTVVGGMTATQPSAPNYQIQIATVTKKSAGDGHIQVIIRPEPQLKDISDVTITTPSAGQALVYNGSNVWINGIPNIANIAYSVSGSNVSGQVANANYSNYSNIANTANSVDVANVSGIGNIATINLTGSTSNVLYGNGVFAAIPTVGNVANANYANFAGNAFSVSGGNVSGNVATANVSYYSNIQSGTDFTGKLGIIQTSGGNSQIYRMNVIVTDSSGNVSFQAGSTTFGTGGFFGNGSGLTNLTGANVSGTVANATYAANAGNATVAASANSVAVANVSGIGNIATINLTGSTSNVLYGNGVFAAIPTVSNVANANYANYAGNAFSVDAGNIVGTVNLANFATTANSVAGANVSGTVANANYSNFSNVANTANSVAVANVSGIGNIATINLTGSTSNVLYGNGVFAALPTISNVANANYANFANIANTANSVAVANVSGIGNIATINLDGNSSNYLAGNGVFGPVTVSSVANANYANFAGNATVSNTVAIINDAANASNQQVLFAGSTTGNLQIKTDGSFTYNPSTNTLSVGNFITFGSNITGPRFISNIATGTAPFVVTSTTQVANLNVANAGQAQNSVSVLSNVTSDTVVYPTFTTTSINVYSSLVKTTSITANLANSSISANTFVGNVTGSAGSVAVANVTGIGNIATINLTGSTSNVLYGNGVFAPVSVTSVANANYANFAGNAFSVDAANIAGTVNLANFATTANSVAGSNVSGTVANATFATTAGSATTAGTVTTNAQPNITSTGTLVSLTVTGNISGGNISTTGLANLANTQLKIYEETVLSSANTSTSISPDAATGSIFRYTANASFSFNGMSNAVSGTSATVIITQDATGGRTMTSTMKFSGGSKTLSTAANAIDIISVFYDGTTYYAVLSKAFA